MAEEKPIGKVIHYYDKISVAIVKLDKKLSIGTMVKFVKGDNVFEQRVESMEVEHGKVTEAKKGDEIGIKVDQTTKVGTLLFVV